jgi:hypothetical protein
VCVKYLESRDGVNTLDAVRVASAPKDKRRRRVDLLKYVDPNFGLFAPTFNHLMT